MVNPKIIAAFQKMIDVNIPIIYIHDFDFVRVDAMLAQVLGKRGVYEWNPASGETHFKNRNEVGAGHQRPLTDFLRGFYNEETEEDEGNEEQFLVLREIQDYIEQPEVKTLLQLMSQRKLYDRSYETTIIIVSSVLKVPEEIKKYVSFLEIGFPTEGEINHLINEHIETNGYDKFDEKDREKLMPSLQGMTAYEIDRMLDMAMSSNGTLSSEDKEMILRQKKQMVKKSGVIELVDAPENIDDIGGLDALKKYFRQKAKIYADLAGAQKFGVSIPKGILLAGMPGCGKSLCAKATASLFEAPLLKLDMGSLLGKYLGDSEENLRKALKIAEASAPCVLWIDEIEKAFSGTSGKDETLTRMFGYILGWMQDKTSTVYVIATSNDVERLPPELKRKGRFDEIFCVNLPNEEERSNIFKVHLNKKRRAMSDEYRHKFPALQDTALKSLAQKTIGFNGADIEAVVNETFERCFLNGQSDITEVELKNTAEETVSISKSCGEQIASMKKAFEKSTFKDATTGKLSKNA